MDSRRRMVQCPDRLRAMAQWTWRWRSLGRGMGHRPGPRGLWLLHRLYGQFLYFLATVQGPNERILRGADRGWRAGTGMGLLDLEGRIIIAFESPWALGLSTHHRLRTRTSGVTAKGWQGAGSPVTQRIDFTLISVHDSASFHQHRCTSKCTTCSALDFSILELQTLGQYLAPILSRYLESNILEFGQPIPHKGPKFPFQRHVF